MPESCRESDAEGTGAGTTEPLEAEDWVRGRGKGPAAGAPALCPKESQEKWTRPGFWSWGLSRREKGSGQSVGEKMEEGPGRGLGGGKAFCRERPGAK